ncbi:hypothetical protein M513_09882 [Trichuris suis]|uniref:Uncharacterized protein n=1 Tax=Trichuris suis TaxID=68888 RepID=A0A085LW85_9BILA|nr:hypothetical protein M513_09882 [Trichuris suis]
MLYADKFHPVHHWYSDKYIVLHGQTILLDPVMYYIFKGAPCNVQTGVAGEKCLQATRSVGHSRLNIFREYCRLLRTNRNHDASSTCSSAFMLRRFMLRNVIVRISLAQRQAPPAMFKPALRMRNSCKAKQCNACKLPAHSDIHA